MKRNILSVLLLPLFLTSCFLFDGGEKDNDNKQTENTQEEKNTQQTETYSLVYDGPTTVILNYGDSYQLSTAKLEGTNKDPNTTYSIRSNTYKNAARVTETGLVTAMEYDRSLSENINEDVKVTLSSEYASNSIIVRFVICHFQENVSFDTIMNGENYYFYTSTGIVENLKCNWNDSQETEPWYAECTLYEEDTGKYFNTTISKSFNYLTLDDNLVTSHYKTVIKRDEKGSTTAKDIKNGSKIKFLTMLRYNEEFGFTNGFNTIMLEEISVPDTLCTIENLNPYLSVDKTSGRYDEEFTVTRTENRFVYVMGEHSEIYAERYLDETQNVGIYKFKSKHIKIYSDENIPETETLYGQFPNGSNAGNAAKRNPL